MTIEDDYWAITRSASIAASQKMEVVEEDPRDRYWRGTDSPNEIVVDDTQRAVQRSGPWWRPW